MYAITGINHPDKKHLIYFFSGNLYFRFDWIKKSVDQGYPLPFAFGWKGVPGSFDSVFFDPEDRYIFYFFKGKYYYRYNWKKSCTEEKGKISDGFKGIPSDVTCALNSSAEWGIIYFFKKGKYYRYNWIRKSLVPGYPRSMKQFGWGLPENPEGAFIHPDNPLKICFIAQGYYYCFDINRGCTEHGYPVGIQKYWPGIPGPPLKKVSLVSVKKYFSGKHLQEEKSRSLFAGMLPPGFPWSGSSSTGSLPVYASQNGLKGGNSGAVAVVSGLGPDCGEEVHLHIKLNGKGLWTCSKDGRGEAHEIYIHKTAALNGPLYYEIISEGSVIGTLHFTPDFPEGTYSWLMSGGCRNCVYELTVQVHTSPLEN